MSRNKKLRKGIESLKKQIEIHEEKKQKSKKEGNIELEEYYKREIESKIKDLERKKWLLEK